MRLMHLMRVTLGMLLVHLMHLMHLILLLLLTLLMRVPARQYAAPSLQGDGSEFGKPPRSKLIAHSDDAEVYPHHTNLIPCKFFGSAVIFML